MSKRRDAFTLIELIVVIAILTLLIGILVPYLSGARRGAKANVCLSQIKGLAGGLVVYLNENNDQFIPGRLSKVPPSNTQLFVNELGAQEPRWHWFLNKTTGAVLDTNEYERVKNKIKSQGYFNDDEVHAPGSTSITNKLFVCPATVDDRYMNDIRHGSYGYNYQYLGNGRQDTDPNRWDNFSVGLHKVKSPTNTVTFADSRGASTPHGKGSYLLDPPRLATEQNAKRMGPEDDDLATGDDPTLMKFSPAEMRHNAQGNVGFADGHAEGMTLKQLGYEVNEKGIALPITDVTIGTMWNNRLWSGLGADKMAEARASQPPSP